MSNDTPENLHLADSLDKMSQIIWEIAYNCQGNSQDLLSLLRTLELLHRCIRIELFEDSLPDNRQALYHLLREIEEKGGWPYIERMRLNALFEHLFEKNHNP